MRNQQSYTQKIVTTGDTIHVYNYDTPIIYGYKKQKKNDLTQTPAYIVENQFSKKEEPRTIPHHKTPYRARKNIQRILSTNIQAKHFEPGANGRPLFITYTFADNIQDLTEANYQFTKYIKRLNYAIYGSKYNQCNYLTVPERQHRGAIHYHTIHWGLPYIEKIYDTISAVWGAGFTWVEKINDLHHLIAYISKYVTKHKQEKGQKSYFTNKGLKQPKVQKNTHREDAPTELHIYSNVYQTEYNIVEYDVYQKVDN